MERPPTTTMFSRRGPPDAAGYMKFWNSTGEEPSVLAQRIFAVARRRLLPGAMISPSAPSESMTTPSTMKLASTFWTTVSAAAIAGPGTSALPVPTEGVQSNVATTPCT